MSNDLKVISAVTNTGDTLPLRAIAARSGNTYWATLAKKANGERYFTKYGVTVDNGVISELPTSIEIEGMKVQLKLDITEKGQRRVRGSGKVNVKGVGNKTFTIRITEMNDGQLFNVNASLRGESAVGGPKVTSEL